MARDTPEAKAAKNLLGALGYIQFNPRVFAVLVEMSSAELQARFLELFLAYIDILAYKWDEKLYTRAERNVCENAKKIQTAMSR